MAGWRVGLKQQSTLSRMSLRSTAQHLNPYQGMSVYSGYHIVELIFLSGINTSWRRHHRFSWHSYWWNSGTRWTWWVSLAAPRKSSWSDCLVVGSPDGLSETLKNDVRLSQYPKYVVMIYLATLLIQYFQPPRQLSNVFSPRAGISCTSHETGFHLHQSALSCAWETGVVGT